MLIDHLAAMFAVDARPIGCGRATAMLGWTAMLLQAATLPEPPVEPLARTSVLPAPCPADTDGDVVVCGRPNAQDTYRLHGMPDARGEDRQFRLKLPGGSTITPHADQGRMGDLQAKVTLKVPF